MNSKIYKNVSIGNNSIVEDYCILGKPPRGKKAGELPLKIGQDAWIRSFSVIYAGTKIGRNLETGTFVSIREDNIIGDSVKIGTTSTLEFGNRIANGTRIHSGCFLEMAEIGENVFIGPHVIIIDDPHPPCPKYKSCKGKVRIEKNAKIGAGAILLAGVTIGKNAIVGAGAIVTKDVLDNTVVKGNPAQMIKQVNELKCQKGFFKKPYDWEKRRMLR